MQRLRTPPPHLTGTVNVQNKLIRSHWRRIQDEMLANFEGHIYELAHGFLKQIKPETSLETKMIKLMLSYFRHIMRRPILWGENAKEILASSRKRERLIVRWMDSIKEAMGL